MVTAARPTDPATIPVLSDGVRVAAPPDRVWAFVRDMANYPLWFRGIVAMDPADERPVATVGKRYAEVAIAPGGREERIVVEVVAADDAARHLAIHAALEPFRPRFDYRVVADGDASRFEWRCAMRARGLKARALRPVLAAILRRRLTPSLEALRRILEARPEKTMRAALSWRFGAARDVLRIVDHAERPTPGPREVVVRQRASAVNPIDVQRRKGYGHNAMRARGALDWPITLGNDVAGEVVAVGRDVTGFAPGDAVIGVKPPSSRGAFAELVALPAANLVAKPAALAFEDAAALPYPFFTAARALAHDAGLSPATAPGRRLFVQGGAGGVGAMAIAIGRHWGMEVIASARAEDHALLRAADVGDTVDYRETEALDRVRDVDVALMTAAPEEEPRHLAMLRVGAGARLVSVVHPTLALTDEHGLVRGLWRAKSALRAKNRPLKAKGQRVAWTLFKVDADAVALFDAMLRAGALAARRDRTYPLADLAAAHERVESGAARGRVVVTIP